jgi:hypothetical protein
MDAEIGFIAGVGSAMNVQKVLVQKAFIAARAITHPLLLKDSRSRMGQFC